MGGQVKVMSYVNGENDDHDWDLNRLSGGWTCQEESSIVATKKLFI